MADYQSMKATIADYLSNDDLSSQIGVEINRAIQHYSETEFYFNTNVWGFKLTPSEESITLASASVSDVADFKIFTLKRSATDTWQAERVSLEEIREINTSGVSHTGEPYCYAIFNNSIYLYPVPNSSYSVDVYGLKRMQPLSASADTNAFLTQAEELIEARVKWRIYTSILKSPQDADREKGNEMDALSKLQSKTTALTGRRRLKPND